MTRSKFYKEAAKRARAAKDKPAILGSDNECSWDGGINYTESNTSDSDYWSGLDSSESDSESDLEELEGKDLRLSLEAELKRELELLNQPSPYEEIRRTISCKEWKRAESNRSLGYNGHSKRTKQRHEKIARETRELQK